MTTLFESSDNFAEDPWKVQNATDDSALAILDNASLPESFENIFKTAIPNSEGLITVAALDKIILSTGLPKATSNKILFMVLGMNQTHIDKREFFVILGLLALAQKNMDVTFDSLNQYKNDLPEPTLIGFENINFRSLRSQPKSRGSFSDPWRNSKNSTQVLNGSQPRDKVLSGGYSQASVRSRRELSDNLPPVADDIIEIQESPELGGLLFKYVNYNVTSKVRNCTVSRRYSDFYWLSEILNKRYPYRMLPALPPKKFGGNKTFFEERRIGLSRFINFLVIHPTLKEDSLVNAFLTEENDISTYRSENNIHVFEEFEFSERNPPTSLVTNKDIKLRVSKAKKVMDQATRQHDKICSSLERMRSRQKVSSKDYLSYSQAISSLAELELSNPCEGYFPCAQIFSQFGEISNYVQKVSVLMNDSADEPFLDVIEGFRRHHMLLLALQDLLSRIDSFDGKEIESVKNRIDHNQTLLDQPSTSDSEFERIKQNVTDDEQLFESLQKRQQFLDHCISQEMDYFHSRHNQTKELYKKFITLELENSIQVSRIWKQLSHVVDGLPTINQNSTGVFTSITANSPSSTSMLLDSQHQ